MNILTVLKYREWLAVENNPNPSSGNLGCNASGAKRELSHIHETRMQAERPRTLHEQVTVGANTSLRGREGQELRDAPDASVGHAAVMMTTPECAYRPLNRGSSLNCCPVAALSVKELRSPDLDKEDQSNQALKYDACEDETEAGQTTAQQGTSLPHEQQRVMREAPAADEGRDNSVSWEQICSEVGISRWADFN